MRKLFYITILAYFIGCDIEPTPTVNTIELRDDFSESEFKNAIIGGWISVFEIKGKENVIYLEFSKQGKVKLILQKENSEENIEGDYSIDFLRPPQKGFVTLAEITITSSKGNIILSRVNFGLHNAFPTNSGLFLRIEESPYGVLKRI